MIKTKRRICLILVVCMIASMLPVTAYAGTGESDKGITAPTGIKHGPMGAATSGSGITGTINIGGETGKDLASDQNGTGWDWDTAEATLTLSETYTNEYIRISCGSDDTINLKYSGNVTVESSSPLSSTIYCAGNMVVDGSSGTLNVNYTGGGDWCAVEVMGELQIIGGNIDAWSNGNTISSIQAVVIYGSKGITISGNANVTATATGTNAHGINTDFFGFITISTGGTVTANGTGEGYAVNSSSHDGTFNISDGTVILNHSDQTHYYLGTLNHTGGTLNGITSGGITSYGITVGGVEVTSENKDKITGVIYNPGTNTLTLNNAVIAGNKETVLMNSAISSDRNLNVELIGNSILGKKPDEQSNNSDYSIDQGIVATGTITVTGSGNLTIYDYTQGIAAENITIDTTGTITVVEHGGGKACCLKADGGKLEIKSGTLNLSSVKSNALYGDNIYISGGNITAEALSMGGESPFAFNKAPTFASNYNHKIFAGADKSSAKEIKNPVTATFTESKYVRIELDTSGGPGNSGKDDDKPVKSAEPSVPVIPEPPKSESKPVGEILKDAGSHWAVDSIQFVYDRGIMTGTSAEEFSPDAQMNRGMLITALGRLARINALDFTSGSFNDVDASSYYAPYAEWSLISNITRGTDGNNFSPDNPVTREELAVILVNFAKTMGYVLPSDEGAKSFEDDSTISPWAREAIEILRSTGIMNGDTGNNFNPKAPATRAEIAAVLQRFIELMEI
ncbi:S-layer homology domain-containing protein [Sedimentibacter sp.]|uniref:S-layer homology domain-containing protein n=1 Tax=Sedimentibacter sp. TaxID=1960295 RepID=UPI0028970FDC|nr:S-layer homology domain-containing protein [Sedimentibacter sp.]